MDGSHVDIITHVEADHRALEALLGQIERTPPDRRGELFSQPVPMLVGHEMAEEEVLYPALRVVTNQVEPTVQMRFAEQAEVEELLTRLEDVDPASAALGPAFARPSEAVRAHAAAEERAVLPRGSAGTGSRRPAMGARYGQAKTGGAHPPAPSCTRPAARQPSVRAAHRSRRPGTRRPEVVAPVTRCVSPIS